MKRGFLLIAAAALAIPAPLALPTPASAQRSWPVDFCKADVPNNPPFVLGDCVGFVRNFNHDTEGLIRFVCDYLRIAEPDIFYASYDSFNECMVDRANDLPPPPY